MGVLKLLSTTVFSACPVTSVKSKELGVGSVSGAAVNVRSRYHNLESAHVLLSRVDDVVPPL